MYEEPKVYQAKLANSKVKHHNTKTKKTKQRVRLSQAPVVYIASFKTPIFPAAFHCLASSMMQSNRRLKVAALFCKILELRSFQMVHQVK